MKLLILLLAVISVSVGSAAISIANAGQIPDYAMASMLASKSRALVSSRTNTTNIMHHADRTRRNRGSVIDPTYTEAKCGGVAIGNVRPIRDDMRHKQVTVIITGNVVNTANQC